MEGPTGVMKQLQALWKILERTDAVMFEHLTVIGAENLHFAFRMLLVLFRRELSFTEVLFMWEVCGLNKLLSYSINNTDLLEFKPLWKAMLYFMEALVMWEVCCT